MSYAWGVFPKHSKYRSHHESAHHVTYHTPPSLTPTEVEDKISAILNTFMGLPLDEELLNAVCKSVVMHIPRLTAVKTFISTHKHSEMHLHVTVHGLEYHAVLDASIHVRPR